MEEVLGSHYGFSLQKRRKGSGGHNVKDRIFHSAATSAGTKTMRNHICQNLIRRTVFKGRVSGLSINDIADVFRRHNAPHSSRTIANIIKDGEDIRLEPAFKSQLIHRKDGSTQRIQGGGITRTRIGRGRSDTKVKLGQITSNTMKWIRFVLLTGFNDLPHIIEAINAGEKPP